MATTYNRGSSRRRVQRGLAAVQLAADLDARGIKVPKPILDAVNTAEAIGARYSDLDDLPDVRAAVVDALIADPGCDIAALAVTETALPTLRNAVVEARDTANSRVAEAVAAHSDTLTDAIRTKLWTPAVDKLTLLAENIPAEATTAQLVADNRIDDARALVEAPHDLEILTWCYRTRDRIYTGSGIAHARHRVWSNPDVFGIDHPDDLLDGIRRGGIPWFGTYTEVDDADARARQDAKKRRLDAEADALTRPRGRTAVVAGHQ